MRGYVHKQDFVCQAQYRQSFDKGGEGWFVLFSVNEMNILAHSYVKVPCHFINVEVAMNSACIRRLYGGVFPV